MPRHSHSPLANVAKNVSVEDHHDDKGHQVENGPEDQVGVTVEGCHVGTMFDVTDAIPAHAGDGPHDDGHSPDDHNDHHHPAVAHPRVQLHAEHRDVPLDGDGQQIGHRGRQAGVDEALAQEPRADRQSPGVRARVEHQVEVGQPGKEVRGGQVGHQVINRKVEAAVDVDGHHDQEVGQHDEDTHGDAESHHQLADRVPFRGQVLPAPVVEEGDGLIVEALRFIHGCELRKEEQ